jgi:hypothetical protein
MLVLSACHLWEKAVSAELCAFLEKLRTDRVVAAGGGSVDECPTFGKVAAVIIRNAYAQQVSLRLVNKPVIDVSIQ